MSIRKECDRQRLLRLYALAPNRSMIRIGRCVHDTAATLIGWWEKENCVNAKTIPGLCLTLLSPTYWQTEYISEAVVPWMTAGRAWVSNEWSA